MSAKRTVTKSSYRERSPVKGLMFQRLSISTFQYNEIDQFVTLITHDIKEITKYNVSVHGVISFCFEMEIIALVIHKSRERGRLCGRLQSHIVP